MASLFDWISLLFMGFVFIISSLVILYSDDYMFGDMNIMHLNVRIENRDLNRNIELLVQIISANYKC
jgi:hypothetical protein